MQEVRAAFMLQPGANGVEAVSHFDALRWATAGSADWIGRPELGRVAAGAAVDRALLTLDELRFSGTGDPLAAAAVLRGASRADWVMMAGCWAVGDGRIPSLDIPALMARHGLAARTLAAG